MRENVHHYSYISTIASFIIRPVSEWIHSEQLLYTERIRNWKYIKILTLKSE